MAFQDGAYASETNNIDLTRGHKEYDSKVKNLEGIFEKVSIVLDISEYRQELKSIQKGIDNDSSLRNKMTIPSMQMDYEGFIYDPYIKKVEVLTAKVEEQLLPFYELYLLSTKIDMQIKEISSENIHDILNNTRLLIDRLNNLNTHNIKERNDLINKAYKTIYAVIMYEEIFDRSDILSYINYLNAPANKETLGRMLTDDLRKLDKSELIDEDLRTIKEHGLGYDYLDATFIRKISRKTVGKQNSEYQMKKRKAIEQLSEKVTNLVDEKNSLSKELKENKQVIHNLRINKALLHAKVVSFVLVPIITFSAGRMIGKSISDNITEYKTITRTINIETGEIVDEPKTIYDDKGTTYVATVTSYEPWKKNSNGYGYIRKATAYEYETPENTDENYHIEVEDLEGNLKEKYTFMEAKDTLDEHDSTEEYTILVTETYQDKSDARKSTKYTLPFAIGGAFLGIAINVVLVLLHVYDVETIREMLDSLNEEIKNGKLSEQEIKNKLKEMYDKAILVKQEYNDAIKKYGELGDQFIFEDIDTLIITNNIRKKTRNF